jgi:hypothetical protein
VKSSFGFAVDVLGVVVVDRPDIGLFGVWITPSGGILHGEGQLVARMGHVLKLVLYIKCNRVVLAVGHPGITVLGRRVWRHKRGHDVIHQMR